MEKISEEKNMNASTEINSVENKISASMEINTVENNVSPSVEQNSEEKNISASMELRSDEKSPLPPPYSEQPQAVAATTAVVVQNMPPMGSLPARRYCPSCNAEIITVIKYKSTTKTHMFAAALCFIGGLLCVWIPYYVKSCRNADHYCPNCQAYLGTYVH